MRSYELLFGLLKVLFDLFFFLFLLIPKLLSTFCKWGCWHVELWRDLNKSRIISHLSNFFVSQAYLMLQYFLFFIDLWFWRFHFLFIITDELLPKCWYVRFFPLWWQEIHPRLLIVQHAFACLLLLQCLDFLKVSFALYWAHMLLTRLS